MTYEMKNMSK